jgi:ech hydrogenase subunit E
VSYSLALGPFEPLLLGPLRIVLKLDGERVADLEYHESPTERGYAGRLPRLDLPQALQLISRICGTCSFAHTLAFCQALEELGGTPAPPRAASLRCAAAELERAAAHLRAAGLVLETLGVEGRARAAASLRGDAERLLRRLTDDQLAGAFCLPGGVRRDLAAEDREHLLVALPKLNRGLFRLADQLIDHRALVARTVEVGTLPRAAAEQFGVRGPLARASGLARDARVDQPYAAYAHLPVTIVTQDGGDVYARLVVLALEALESCKLAESALADLPDGPCLGDWPRDLPDGAGRSAVEGPRGMIRYVLRAAHGRLAEARIDTPRQIDRLLARTLLVGALVDDAAAILASCNICTACAEA